MKMHEARFFFDCPADYIIINHAINNADLAHDMAKLVSVMFLLFLIGN